MVSLVSRLRRSLELRVTEVRLDPMAELFIRTAPGAELRLVANEPDSRDPAEYREKLWQIRADHDLPDEDVVFVEVTVVDPSDFESALDVHGEVVHDRYRVLTMRSATVANALAALLLHVRDESGVRPAHVLRVDGGQSAGQPAAVPRSSASARSPR